MAETTYTDVDVASGNAAQVKKTRADDNIAAQVIWTNTDDDIEVVFEQSMDDTNWDPIKDDDGQVFKIVCPKRTRAPLQSGHLSDSLAGVFAQYIRAHLRVLNATVGTVTIILDC